MELANVAEPTRHKNGVKYLLVSQELCGRNVDAKGMTVKDSNGTVGAFLCNITKKMDPKELGSTKEQNLLEISKIFGKLKEYKFTLQ